MGRKRFSDFPYSNQVGIVVLATILVFFIVAFAGRALEQYRVERELEAVSQHVDELRDRQEALQATATYMTTTQYKDEELRKAGYGPLGETPVAAQAVVVTPQPTSQPTVQVWLPEPVQPIRIDKPPYWELWRRLLVGAPG